MRVGSVLVVRRTWHTVIHENIVESAGIRFLQALK
jgi:hypothetical protein